MIIKNQPIHILDEVIAPGERKEILVPMPKLYDGSPLYSHVHVINGKNPGPTLCLIGALHGDELNGIEIIRTVLKSKRISEEINGALIAIPVVNVHGVLYQQRYLLDRRDLNRSFPGSEQGSLAARVANLFYSEIIQKCTHLIDLHTGSLHRDNLPQVRASLVTKEIRALAEAFNAPVVLNAKTIEGSLREIALQRKISILVYEAGEALRLNHTAIKFGVRGIFNVMSYLKMIKSDTVNKPIPSLICESSAWIRAKSSGLFVTSKFLGNTVKTNDKLGSIGTPIMTLNEEVIKTPIPGIIIGINNIPLVHEGAALYNIATLDKLTKKQMRLLELLDNDDSEKIVDDN